MKDKNLESKIKEVGGRNNLYANAFLKFSIKTGYNTFCITKNGFNTLKQKLYQGTHKTINRFKDVSQEIKEFSKTGCDTINTFVIGSFPHEMQNYMAKKYLPDLNEEENPGRIPTIMNLFLESTLPVAYTFGGDVSPKIAIPLLIDIIGRTYILGKEKKSSAIGEGILKIPKIAIESLDSICLKYLSKNKS